MSPRIQFLTETYALLTQKYNIKPRELIIKLFEYYKDMTLMAKVQAKVIDEKSVEMLEQITPLSSNDISVEKQKHDADILRKIAGPIYSLADLFDEANSLDTTKRTPALSQIPLLLQSTPIYNCPIDPTKKLENGSLVKNGIPANDFFCK